jgi:tetratricopeptide (TPR) repeat protein
MNCNRLRLLGVAATLVLVAGLAWGQKDAKTDLDKLLEQVPSLVKEEKNEQAVEVLRKVLTLAPQNDRYLAAASDLERKTGQYAEGFEHALQAIKINDKVGVYYVLAAGNALGMQDLKQAQRYAELAVKFTSSSNDIGYQDARNLNDLLHRKIYTITWNLDPKKGQMTGNRFEIALPRADLPYQTMEFKVQGARRSTVKRTEANDLLLVEPLGTKPFKVITRIVALPYTFKDQLAKKSYMPMPREAQDYLGAGEGIDPTSPKLAKVVADLKGRDSVETIKNIALWMKKHVTYKREGKSIVKLDFKTADEIIERGHAECRGYTILFVALARAAGIPARPVWGVAIIPTSLAGNGPRHASHNWAEFYVPGTGWVPIDPQKPETLGCLPNNNLRFFMDGRSSATSTENLPLLNLLYMNGEDLKFEETRG